MHPVYWLAAVAFQLVNGTQIGGWLGGYGPTSANDWDGRRAWMLLGTAVWAAGLLGNIYHDDVLREIRRAAACKQQRQEEKARVSVTADAKEDGTRAVEKVYMMPERGLFRFILYPHYVCEWIEWAGYWMVGGRRCHPARRFLLNEIATMTPRALQGQRWYLARFGREKVGGRRALVPGWL